jgi:Golgi phosphoprotein 3 (GPP34)
VSPPAGGQLQVAGQLMLLAFSPGDGRLHSAVRHNPPMGVAGAILAELAIHRTIGIDPRGGHAEKHRVLAMGPGTGDPLLDSTAAQIQAHPPRTLA